VLDVRRLVLLRELKMRGTLAAVATALNQSPSSVSQQLTRLEREVGVELLQKSGRRVQLTLQAEILVEHTRIVVERLERAEADLAASLTTVSGTVRMAVFQSAAIALVPRALTILAEEYPGLRVELTQREPVIADYETWSRDFDVVVTQQFPGQELPYHPDLDVIPLAADALRLGIPPSGRPWSHIRSLPDAVAAPWIMEQRGVWSRQWAEDACRRAGFEPEVRFEVTDLQAQMLMIEAGNGVAIIPDLFARSQDSTIRLIDLPGAPQRKIFTSVRRSLAASPRIRAVRDVLARVAAEAIPGTRSRVTAP
jgi:DNA-binding transcriptional LysR family regulator